MNVMMTPITVTWMPNVLTLKEAIHVHVSMDMQVTAMTVMVSNFSDIVINETCQSLPRVDSRDPQTFNIPI